MRSSAKWTSGLGIACVLASGCVPREAPQAAAQPAATDATGHDNSRERLEPMQPLPANSVAGADADGDHIRDDIAAFIDQEYAANELKRLGARQFARALQHELAYAGDRDRVFDADAESDRSIECLYAQLGADLAGPIWRELVARTIDTEERLMAYEQVQQALSGGYFKGALDPRKSCAFDLTGLTP